MKIRVLARIVLKIAEYGIIYVHPCKILRDSLWKLCLSFNLNQEFEIVSRQEFTLALKQQCKEEKKAGMSEKKKLQIP